MTLSAFCSLVHAPPLSSPLSLVWDTMDASKNVFATVGVLCTAAGLAVLAKKAFDAKQRSDAVRRCARLEAEVAQLRAALQKPREARAAAAPGSYDVSDETKSEVAAQFAHLKSEDVSVPVSLAPGRKEIRVYIDGCFDMMHFGHRYARHMAGGSASVCSCASFVVLDVGVERSWVCCLVP